MPANKLALFSPFVRSTLRCLQSTDPRLPAYNTLVAKITGHIDTLYNANKWGYADALSELLTIVTTEK